MLEHYSIKGLFLACEGDGGKVYTFPSNMYSGITWRGNVPSTDLLNFCTAMACTVEVGDMIEIPSTVSDSGIEHNVVFDIINVMLFTLGKKLNQRDHSESYAYALYSVESLEAANP